MKKFLALLLSVLMVLSLLAACGDDISKGDTKVPVGNQEGNETKGDETVTFTTGTLIVNAGAAFEITYDAQGLVREIQGMDEMYKEFVDFLGEESRFVGLSCDEVIAEMIKSIGVKGYLDDRGCVLIKQSKDAALPNEAFLDGIQRSAQSALDAAAAEVALVMVTAQQLNAEGHIDLPTAKTLVQHFLGYELTNFDGTSLPVGGLYAFTAGADGTEEQVLVNAVTGSVDYGVLEEEPFDDPDATAPEEDPTPTEDNTQVEEPVEDTVPTPTENAETEG